MKIALCSSFVPFIDGGDRNIVEWLEATLVAAGHTVERIYLPEVDSPQTLFQQMAAFRFVDLSAADRVICFRPQSHLIRHRHKIVWFIHHLRVFYDLWEHDEYRDFPADLKHIGFRDALQQLDTAALAESRHIFTNSQVVSDRLMTFNRIASEPLFPPVFNPERFFFRSMSDEIVCICRMEHHKRQHLLVEALKHCRTAVKVRLCGSSSGATYPDSLRKIVEEAGLHERVVLDNRWIEESEKVDYLADCLAAAYMPLDEDSYGYPTLEAAHARKPILTTTDSGGVMEFIQHGINGFAAEPDPRAIALEMDKLFLHREMTEQMGRNAQQRIADMRIGWDHVLRRLLS